MMTRAEVRAQFINVDKRGIVRDPGKFEAEPLYVPYFWDAFLNGCADDDDGTVLTFDVTEEDIKEFPELEGIKQVKLEETDTGFVNHEDVR